jgi:hypothetical protein
MKKLICLTFAALIVSCVFAQTKTGEHEWKITLHILDESGSPVAGASAGVGFFTNSTPTGIDGITDTNGNFVVTHSDTPSESAYPLSFRIEKQGYYFTWAQVDLGQGYDPAKWNQSVTLTLKKVGKPIAMYAKQIHSLVVPEFNKAIGYDLMVGDWVGSYGKGVNIDLFITEKHTTPQSNYILSVSFPQLGDGIQEFTVPDAENGSGLRSAHEAPVDGYRSEVSQTTMANPNRNFYFRVRTKLDENGNVVSARYGKIYGDLAQFTYYFNPTLNDRNVEFDPKQNLLGGIQSFQQVTAP